MPLLLPRLLARLAPDQAAAQPVAPALGRHHSRLWDIARFGVPGALLLLAAYELSEQRILPPPLAALVGFFGALVMGFGLLPPVAKPAPPPARSERSKRPGPRPPRKEKGPGPPIE